MRVLVVEGRADVLPVVGECRLDVLLGGDHHRGVGGGDVEQRVEAVGRQQLGDVGALVGVGQRGDLGGLAVLGRQLGGRRDLDGLELAERALGERREVTQRLDLDVEQVGADRVVLGRREDVDDAAADRELAAVVDLLDALVARVDERDRELVEVDQVALGDREAGAAAATGRAPSR